MKLDLAEGLVIDLDETPFKTEGLRLFIAGVSGAGKSYAEIKTLEVAYTQGLQFVLLDPHSEGYVLADQQLSEQGPGIVVASERYGVPVAIDAIEVYVDILRSGRSLVIDLSAYYYDRKKRPLFNEFVEQFLSALQAAWANVRRPIIVALDEAHVFAPQTKTKGSEERVALVSELATGGRKLGINLILCTQRPAMIDKTPITQANVRLIGKLSGTQDYAAFKDYIGREISFSEIQALQSGNFAAVVQGAVRLIRIYQRLTQDAGATPDAAPIISSKIKLDMSDIAERIREAIQASSAEKEKKEHLEQKFKAEQAKTENLKAELSKMQERLETLEFISDRMSSQPKPKKQRDSAPTEATPNLQDEIRAQIAHLEAQHRADLQAKDAIIARLEQKQRESDKLAKDVSAFTSSLRELVGNGINGTPSLDIDDIADRVAARVGGATVYEVAPLEAIRLDWQKRSLAEMQSSIDGLSHESLNLLSYLISISRYSTKRDAAKALFGRDSGSAYTQLNQALVPLKSLSLAKDDSKNGIRATVEDFIVRSMGDRPEDLQPLTDHVLAHIRLRLNGGAAE